MHASYAAPLALHDERLSMMYDVLHKTVLQNDVESAYLRAHSQSVRPARLAASPFRAQALNFIQTLHAHWQQKSRNHIGGYAIWFIATETS